MKNEQWFEAAFELSNGVKFAIVHDIPGKGSINTIQAAFDCWLARTNDYTAESLVKYINSKGVHRAMTKEKYDFLNK